MAKQIYYFTNSATAWQFMRDCDDAGVSAGYPSIEGRHSVTVVAHVLAPGLAHYRQQAPVAEESDLCIDESDLCPVAVSL